jgi:hypothetical protein
MLLDLLLPTRNLHNNLSSSSASSSTSTSFSTYADLIHNNQPLPQYTIHQVINAARIYRSRYALLHYNPSTNKFTGYYSKQHEWVTGNNKLIGSITVVTKSLRNLFPDRFSGSSSSNNSDGDEFVMAISSGDYPAISRTYGGCIHNNHDSPCDESLLSDKGAPILHFGSVFRHAMFPNMIGMPMPGDHLNCFENYWLFTTQPKTVARECGVFVTTPESYVLPWDELIPQLIWRGTDFRFLQIQSGLSQPYKWKNLMNNKMNGDNDGNNGNNSDAATADEKKARLIETLKNNYNNLVPRWKGVIHTAESEIEAARINSPLPKINIKFTHVAEGGMHSAIGATEYAKFEEIGFPVAGEYMNGLELAKYKYHIDLGGGGGTTWTGTTHKLGMPGLLFHHVTPTKDYIHDYIKPFVHYVPVQSDLSDLLEKLEWAESHPKEAKRISDNATELIKRLKTLEGFEPLFQEYLLKPLQAVVEAYTPLKESSLNNDGGEQQQFEKLVEDSMTPFIECADKCKVIR